MTTDRNHREHHGSAPSDQCVNEFHGTAYGPVLQVGQIGGDVYLHSPPAIPNRSCLELPARHLSPVQLRGRENELKVLADFCVSDETYLCWQGQGLAGKTALAAWTVLHPPTGVVAASYFIRSGTGENNSEACSRSLIDQLACLASEPSQRYIPKHALDHERGRLLELAGTRLQASGQLLLLVIDGLDQDRHTAPGRDRPSIASLLPAEPPAGVKIMITARPQPDIPGDVQAGHPLLGTPRQLAVSKDGVDRGRAAADQLNGVLYGGDQLKIDVIGYVIAAEGGLTAADLGELTDTSELQIGGLLASAFSRCLNRNAARSGSTAHCTWFYLFDHKILLTAAEDALGGTLDKYRRGIHDWADSYRTLGWPDMTPQYLLADYGRLLSEHGDLARLASCASDLRRHDRMLAAQCGAGTVYAEVEAAQRLLVAEPELELPRLAVLTVRRMQLEARETGIPEDLPKVWARLGDTRRATMMARGFREPGIQAKALAVVASSAGPSLSHQRRRELIKDVERILSRVGDPLAQAEVFAALLPAVALGCHLDAADVAARARNAARRIGDEFVESEALLALVRTCSDAGLWELAEQVAGDVDEPETLSVAYDGLVHDLATAREWGRGERIVAKIEDDRDQGRAASALCTAMATAQHFGRCEETALAIAHPGWRAVALARMARELPAADLTWALRLVDQAHRLVPLPGMGAWIHVAVADAVIRMRPPLADESGFEELVGRATSTTDPARRTEYLAALAQVVAPIDVAIAQMLSSHTRAAASMLDTHDKAWSLFQLAESFAEAEMWDQAEQLVRDVDSEAARSQMLTWLADKAAPADAARARKLATEAERTARSIEKPLCGDLEREHLLTAAIATGQLSSGQITAMADAVGGPVDSHVRLATESCGQGAASGAIDRPNPIDPTELAASLAWRQEWDAAEAVANGVEDPAQRLLGLYEVVRTVPETEHELRARLAAGIAQALQRCDITELDLNPTRVCRILTVGGQWASAEQTLETIEDPDDRHEMTIMLAQAYSEVGRMEDVHRLVTMTTCAHEQIRIYTLSLAQLARADRGMALCAESALLEIIGLLPDENERATAEADLCDELLAAGMIDEAEGLARRNPRPLLCPRLLAAIATTVFPHNLFRGTRLVQEAVAMATAIADLNDRAWALVQITRTLAGAGLWDHAVPAIDAIEYPDERSSALLAIGMAQVAARRWDEAEHTARSVTDVDCAASIYQQMIVEISRILQRTTDHSTILLLHTRQRRALALALVHTRPFEAMKEAATTMPDEVAGLCEAITQALLETDVAP